MTPKKLPAPEDCLRILRRIDSLLETGYELLDRFVTKQQLAGIIIVVEDKRKISSKLNESSAASCSDISHAIDSRRSKKGCLIYPPDEEEIERFLDEESSEDDTYRMAAFAFLGIAMMLRKRNEK